jgi:hypothetical protein
MAKHPLAALFFALSLFAPGAASAWDTRAPRLGLGLEVGDPTGLSAKYYVSRNTALEGGLGFFGWPWGSGGHLDFLYEFRDAVRTGDGSYALPLFVGLGAKGGGYTFCDAAKSGVCDVDGFAGVRIPIGAALQLANEPFEMQLEFAPGFFAPFTYGLGLEADLSLALRYYF